MLSASICIRALDTFSFFQRELLRRMLAKDVIAVWFSRNTFSLVSLCESGFNRFIGVGTARSVVLMNSQTKTLSYF